MADPDDLDVDCFVPIPLLYSRLARFTGSPLTVTRTLEAELGQSAPSQPAE